ncbi:MAG: exodeoxyribonuclease VII small subunit [Candidatus Kapaibacterium sp.]|nr:MAG: exodeoxyribonuclease VII small subunit [Candidatus Kapabacteria bacterium]
MKKKTSPAESTTTSFEERFQRLEEIVDILDSADAPLEEMLALYEEGMRLSEQCASQLQAAEQKIFTLKNGALQEAE